ADEVIDEDDFRLLKGFEAACKQRGLDRDHAEEKEIVAGERRGRGIEAPGQDHQRNRDAAEQAGPALLQAEANEFIKRRRPWPPRHRAADARLSGAEAAPRQPGGGRAWSGPDGFGIILWIVVWTVHHTLA